MTDSLADVIHIIHLGGKGGMLTVESSEDRTLEEGFIAFIDGRVVEARVSQSALLAAFTYLNSWQACRFSFVGHAVNGTSPSLRPTQLRPDEEMLQHPEINVTLPRIHRRLLSLVNGQRNVSSLHTCWRGFPKRYSNCSMTWSVPVSFSS